MSIDEVLREQDIMLGLPAKGKRSALSRIAALLSRRVGISRDAVLVALLDRERLGSTGVGHGVAIPHGRPNGIAGPAAVLARLEKPVCFGAPDGEPVDLVLTLLWPKSNIAGFLPALARICRLLRSADLRRRLRAATPPEEAYAPIILFDRRSAERPTPRRSNVAAPWCSGELVEAIT